MPFPISFEIRKYLHLLHNHKRVEGGKERDDAREFAKISEIFHDRVTIYRAHRIRAKNREGRARPSLEGNRRWNSCRIRGLIILYQRLYEDIAQMQKKEIVKEEGRKEGKKREKEKNRSFSPSRSGFTILVATPPEPRPRPFL